MKEYENIKVSGIEKVIINWAVIPDCLFYTIKSKIKNDEYSSHSLKKRFQSICESRINRYKKAIKLREEYGKINHQKLIAKSLCDYTRVYLSAFR